MEEITTIALDIAKSVLQVHAVSAAGTVLIRRQLKRRYVQFFAGLKPCLIGIEACATAHHLGAGDGQTRPRGSADAAKPCETLRQAQ